MQTSEFEKREKRGPLSWRLSAGSARLRTRLGGTLFSSGARAKRRAAEQFAPEYSQACASENPQESALEAEPKIAPDSGYSSGPVPAVEAPRERVIFFAPGPVTEADFYRDSRKIAAVVKRRRRRHRSTRWMAENVGTMLVVAVLFILAWMLSAR
jgi:hypothetical protein